MAVVEGEPPLRKNRHNSDNADNLDNDKEVYDHSQKAKARPTSDTLPPSLPAGEKTSVLPSSPPSSSSHSSSSSSLSSSSPSSSSWSSSSSCSSYSFSSGSTSRRSSVTSVSRSGSGSSSPSNSSVSHHRRRGKNGGRNARGEQRSTRFSHRDSTPATDDDPGISRRPASTPKTKGGIPRGKTKGGSTNRTDARPKDRIRRGNNNGEKANIDGRPRKDGGNRKSSVAGTEADRGKRRLKNKSHYDGEKTYRRPSGVDTDYDERHRNRRQPGERRKGQRRSHSVHRGEGRYSRHGSYDEASRARGGKGRGRSSREPEHSHQPSGDHKARRGRTERRGAKTEKSRRDNRYAADALGDADTSARQSRHRARESEKRRPEREPRKMERTHKRHHRRLSLGDTGGVTKKEADGAESSDEVRAFGAPLRPEQLVAVPQRSLGLAWWAGIDSLDSEEVEITLGKYTSAVITIQRIVRGHRDRGRVSRRRNARVVLRDACLEVGMNLIEEFIRQEMAPGVIASVLAEGVEGVIKPSKRMETSTAAQAILEETMASMVTETVTLAVREETNSHLDVIFVRDRRNPLLALVDDVVSDTLRVCIKEVVMEAVRECTEDFMFGRRLSALVEELIEEEVVGSAGPIAHEVYYSSSALATFWELEQEVCTEEAVAVVAETMAPFEDHLVHLQRRKDVAAIQSAAQSVVVKGLQLQHASRTLGQMGKLVIMSDINGKTLNLLLAGRFLAILRAAETNRLQVTTSPLLLLLFRRLVVRTGRSVLLEELSRELDRDETALHELELERIDEVDRQRRAARNRAEEGAPSSSTIVKP